MKFNLSGDVPATPFYWYDMSLLRRTLEAVLEEAKKYNYHIHYALKANVEPEILETIANYGLGADCVSGWEVEAALKAGFATDKIVFAGVGKSDSEILLGLKADIFSFNCESLQELEVINDLAKGKGKIAKVALRINPNVEPDTHKYISTGHGQSKFGIAYTEVNTAIERLDKLNNVEIVGLHFHIGSQVLGLDFFEDLAIKVTQIDGWFASRGVNVAHLNVGGGLGIDYENPDANPIADFADYFNRFAKHLPKNKTIHFELGRSLVAQCGELITRVLYTKDALDGIHYAIVDAGMTELIRPALYGAHHKIENLSANADGRKNKIYYIGGPICESSDVFAHEIEFPETFRGDVLTMRSVGAYGSVMASHYNLRPSAPSYFSN